MSKPKDLALCLNVGQTRDAAKLLKIAGFSTLSNDERKAVVTLELKKRNWEGFKKEELKFFAEAVKCPSSGTKTEISNRIQLQMKEVRKEKKKKEGPKEVKEGTQEKRKEKVAQKTKLGQEESKMIKSTTIVMSPGGTKTFNETVAIHMSESKGTVENKATKEKKISEPKAKKAKIEGASLEDPPKEKKVKAPKEKLAGEEKVKKVKEVKEKLPLKSEVSNGKEEKVKKPKEEKEKAPRSSDDGVKSLPIPSFYLLFSKDELKQLCKKVGTQISDANKETLVERLVNGGIQYGHLSKDQLKGICTKLNLSTNGSVADLVGRLELGKVKRN